MDPYLPRSQRIRQCAVPEQIAGSGMVGRVLTE